MSPLRSPRLGKLRSALQHAFSLESPHGPLSEQDREVLKRVARYIEKRKLSAPALLVLGSLGPLNYVGSQALFFLRPFLGHLFPADRYLTFTRILERREGVAALMQEIESATRGGSRGEGL